MAGAHTCLPAVAQPSAWTGIAGRDENHIARKDSASLPSGDGDPPFLQRHPHGIDDRSVKLCDLIQKQHTCHRPGERLISK